MTLLEKHLAFVESQIGVCVYILGGEGQKVDEAYIKAHSSGDHEKDALALYRKLKAAGIKNVLCWDCSGLITEDLIDKGVISGDKTANGLLKMCTVIDKGKAYPGCLAFRVTDTDKDGKNEKSDHGHHVGEVTKMVDGVPWVTEAKGHAYGVVCKPVNHYGKGYWEIFGVPYYLGKMGGQTQEVIEVINKFSSAPIIKEAQETMIFLGFKGGMDESKLGQWGSRTESALGDFQASVNLPRKPEIDAECNAAMTKALREKAAKAEADYAGYQTRVSAYVGGVKTAASMKI